MAVLHIGSPKDYSGAIDALRLPMRSDGFNIAVATPVSVPSFEAGCAYPTQPKRAFPARRSTVFRK